MINGGQRRALSARFQIGPSEIMNYWKAAQASQLVAITQLNGSARLWLMIDRLPVKATQLDRRQTFFCGSVQQLIDTICVAVCNGGDKGCAAVRVCKKVCWVTPSSLDCLFNRNRIGLAEADICAFNLLSVC